MPERLAVAVIGAGLSGLVTARAMRDAGHRVTVVESRAEVGGVWSASRRYPGLGSQTNKGAYSFSDLKMPDAWPLQPTGEQMGEYLNRYADDHALRPLIRFGQQVVDLRRGETGWAMTLAGETGQETLNVDAVVVASGVYNHPHVPDWSGRAAFEAAGGQVLLPEQLAIDAIAGKRIAVVGWGKTACDLAVTLAPHAAMTTIIARRLTWKAPPPSPLRLTEILWFSRLGQWLLLSRRKRLPRALHHYLRKPLEPVRKLLAAVIARELDLHSIGIRPMGDLSEVTNQVTAGLFEAIRAGEITVQHGADIQSLRGGASPMVQLANGKSVPADVVVVATGYRPRLDYLDPAVIARLAKDDGQLALDRTVHNEAEPGLYFVGWSQNNYGFTCAEVSALWATAHLAGWPSVLQRQGATRNFTRGDGLRGVPTTSLGDIDEQLADMGYPLPLRTRLGQWVRTVDVQDYAPVFAAIRRRLQQPGASVEQAAAQVEPERSAPRYAQRG